MLTTTGLTGAGRATNRRLRSRTKDAVTGYGLALVGVGVTSAIIAAADQLGRIANISMLYLMVVLAVALGFGSGPAIFAAFAAFFVFNFFFTEPRYTLAVAEPAEYLALFVLLGSGIVAGQLAGTARRRAAEARSHERDALLLYEVVRLLSEASPASTLDRIADRVLRALGAAAIRIEVGSTRLPDEPAPITWRTARGDPASLERLLSATGSRVMTGRQPGRWVRIAHGRGLADRVAGEMSVVPIAVQNRQVGQIAIARPEPLTLTEERLLASIATQIGVVYERTRLAGEALDAEVLRKTDELRAALMNAVSHDLRTPLASIIASAGSLRQAEPTWTDAERIETGAAIEQEATRLNRMIGNLLDLSRIEAGSLQPHKEWHDLADLVHDAVNRVRAREPGRRVDVAEAPPLPPVSLDYVEIDQAVTNLLENAVKHTPPTSAITVRLDMAPGEVVVTVEDGGTGIREADAPNLFKPFYRGADASGTSGSGVGLAVVQGFVDAHGGRTIAENRAEGGARFGFALPVAADEPAP